MVKSANQSNGKLGNNGKLIRLGRFCQYVKLKKRRWHKWGATLEMILNAN